MSSCMYWHTCGQNLASNIGKWLHIYYCEPPCLLLNQLPFLLFSITLDICIPHLAFQRSSALALSVELIGDISLRDCLFILPLGRQLQIKPATLVQSVTANSTMTFPMLMDEQNQTTENDFVQRLGLYDTTNECGYMGVSIRELNLGCSKSPPNSAQGCRRYSCRRVCTSSPYGRHTLTGGTVCWALHSSSLSTRYITDWQHWLPLTFWSEICPTCLCFMEWTIGIII